MAVIPISTPQMKTAISVSDSTFEQVTRQAKQLGISRSEFFSRAASRYLTELSSQSLITQLNEAQGATYGDDTAAIAANAGRYRLGLTDGEDDW
jgi:hypothetical protein